MIVHVHVQRLVQYIDMCIVHINVVFEISFRFLYTLFPSYTCIAHIIVLSIASSHPHCSYPHSHGCLVDGLLPPVPQKQDDPKRSPNPCQHLLQGPHDGAVVSLYSNCLSVCYDTIIASHTGLHLDIKKTSYKKVSTGHWCVYALKGTKMVVLLQCIHVHFNFHSLWGTWACTVHIEMCISYYRNGFCNKVVV